SSRPRRGAPKKKLASGSSGEAGARPSLRTERRPALPSRLPARTLKVAALPASVSDGGGTRRKRKAGDAAASLRSTITFAVSAEARAAVHANKVVRLHESRARGCFIRDASWRIGSLQRDELQPLTAPLVSPAMNSFCRAKKRMAGGM